MIIKLLLDLIFGVFSLLLLPINLPALPSTVSSYLDSALDYLSPAVGIVANFVPMPVLLTYFGIILAIDVGINLYKFILWVIKKIPMLGIE